VKSKNLTGDKIEIVDVLDKKIEILDYRVKESKYSRDGMCLTLQIKFEGKIWVVFTGSKVLLEEIQSLTVWEKFTTTIIKVPFKEKQFFLKFT
jgi:hypothetical protein